MFVEALLRVELRNESRGEPGGDRGGGDILAVIEISAGGSDEKRSSISIISSTSSKTSISSIGNIAASFDGFLSSILEVSEPNALLL